MRGDMKTLFSLDHFLSMPTHEQDAALASMPYDKLMDLIEEISEYTSVKMGECAMHGVNDEWDPEFFSQSCPSILKAEIAESHQLWQKTSQIVQERFGFLNMENASNQYLSNVFEKLRNRGVLQVPGPCISD